MHWSLQVLVIALLVAPSSDCQERGIDFANFTFPVVAAEYSAPPGFQWAVALPSTVHLENGRFDYKCEFPPCPYITLDTVKLTDVTGDGKPEAIVPLVFHSGGTQYWRTVYVYALRGATPELLGAFLTGERADGGLHRVYGRDRKLVVELNDPTESQGACCATWRIRHIYAWRKRKFVEIGKAEIEPIPPSERTWRIVE
jgi:hypothetical protein